MSPRRERLERRSQRGHAGRGQRPHRGPVVGELAGDQLDARRVALSGVIGLGELPRRLDRLRAAGGEEHTVEVARREAGDARGELDRARVSVAPVRVETELLSLLRGGLPELSAAVADVHAVQRREPVQVALAVLVVHVAAIASHDHRDVAVGVDAHPREVHPQVALGQALQITLLHWTRNAHLTRTRALAQIGARRGDCHRALSSQTHRIQLDTKDNGTAPRCPAQGTARSTSVAGVVLNG
jgi:hypothetical protein